MAVEGLEEGPVFRGGEFDVGVGAADQLNGVFGQLDEGDVVGDGEVLGSGDGKSLFKEGGFHHLWGLNLPKRGPIECLFYDTVGVHFFDGVFSGDGEGSSSGSGSLFDDSLSIL